jgi:tetratricopeptide (TPR) repeat protein
VGVELAALGKIEEAIQHYETALRIRPDFEKALNNIGSLLAQKGKIQDAVRYWTKAAQIAPDYTGVHYNLFLAFTQLGDSAAAGNEYARLKSLDPVLAEKARKMVERTQ